MLIVIPPSETKRPPLDAGEPVAPDRLSFPALTQTREQVLDALIATSASPDAFRRLQVGPSMAEEVARNTFLRELPARPVLEIYSGPLHAGLDAATLSPAATKRAAECVVVASALWGLLRPVDEIPPYRLHICARLVGMDRLESTWRGVIPEVLAEAAQGASPGVFLDLRSPGYQDIGLPDGMAERTVTLRVRRDAPGGRRIGDVIAKRVRGEAAHHLLESGRDPVEPESLAEIIAERWPVQLAGPARPGKPWTLTLLSTD